MAKSNEQSQKGVILGGKIECPYCLRSTLIQPAADYRPIYVNCTVCGKRFIAERIQSGIEALKVEDASCFSDPDRREIEMGMGDEE
jgi:hypothetical protein